jgi:hypothetical protein
MTSSIISSIALEEARTAAILGSKRRCENVFDLDLYGYDVVYRCDVVTQLDVINIVILCGFVCMNECVGFRYVYGCIIYYMKLLCRFYNSSCVGYSIFYKKNYTG